MNFKLFHEFIPVRSKNWFELGHILLFFFFFILRNNENWRLQIHLYELIKPGFINQFELAKSSLLFFATAIIFWNGFIRLYWDYRESENLSSDFKEIGHLVTQFWTPWNVQRCTNCRPDCWDRLRLKQIGKLLSHYRT